MLFRVGIVGACLIAGVSAAAEEFQFKTLQGEFSHDPDADSVVHLRMLEADFDEIKGLGICDEFTGFINGSSFPNPECGKRNEMAVRVYWARYSLIDEELTEKDGFTRYDGFDRRGGDILRTIYMRQVEAGGNIWEGQSIHGRHGSPTVDFQSDDSSPITFRFVSEVVPNSELKGQQLDEPLYVSQQSFAHTDMMNKFVHLKGRNTRLRNINARITEVQHINPTTSLWWSEPRLRMSWMSDDRIHEKHIFCKGSLQGRVRCLKQVGPDYAEVGVGRHKYFVDALSNDLRSSEIEIENWCDPRNPKLKYISREFNPPSGMGW